MKRGRAVHGYTLVELVVVMGIFAVVMALIGISFANIVRSASQLGKRVETDIGGLIGLELMRGDLELAGFGLPWTLPEGLNYVEAEEELQLVTSCGDGCPDARPSRYNDSPFFTAPPAYRVGGNVGFNGSDYLVLKGTALGASEDCRGWGYLNYSSNGSILRPSRLEPGLKPGSKARAIVISSGTDAFGNPTRALVTAGSNFTFTLNKELSEGFAPRSESESHLVYGVADAGAGGANLKFPFNRSDYYINRKTDISAACNPGTGTLYKTTINHAGGDTRYPILDCAADMQVVLYMDTNLDGKIDYHPDPADASFTAADLREQLKEIRVYILAQEGKRDPAYLYPVRDPARAIVVGDPELMGMQGDQLGHVWTESAFSATFGPDWRNYHWKIYTIAVQPKNL